MRQLTPAVKNLLIINFIVWLATVAFSRMSISVDLYQWLGLHYWSAPNTHIWQPITYMFMHGGFDHLFFNIFALWMFGTTIEQAWGTKKFLIFYFVTGIGAALTQEIVWTIQYQPLLSALSAAAETGNGSLLVGYESIIKHYLSFNFSLENAGHGDLIRINQMMVDALPNALTTVGASGAIFGLLFAFGWLFPEAKIFLLFVPIPIPSRIFVALYAVAELIFGLAGSIDGVAHFAHLGGMLFGWLLLLYWRKKGF